MSRYLGNFVVFQLQVGTLFIPRFTEPCDLECRFMSIPVFLRTLAKDRCLFRYLLSDEADVDRTAEIAANAPRYRRKSSTFIDAIHDIPHGQDLAPAQLYSTMSGRLFHSGRIAIVMVGPPARGKT